MNEVEMILLKAVGESLIKRIEESMPNWKNKLHGNTKKAYEAYIKSIEDDVEYVKTAKDILKKNKKQEIEFLETEKFYSELVFVYIQHHYYLKPKKIQEEQGK